MQAVPIAHPGQFFIGGEWVKPSSDATIRVLSPATEELYVTVAEANEADIGAAVDAARKAFDEGPWPRLSHRERAAYLRAFGRELEARLGDLASIWPNEMGITLAAAKVRAATLPGTYNFYADLAETFPFEEVHASQVATAGMIVREPVGVVGAIIPWNSPAQLLTFKLAPALLAGCTVVIKASPQAPGQLLLFGEVSEAVGLPPGVLNVVTADRTASAALVADPRVDKIAFTGSTAAGKAIAGVLAQRIGRCTLELGGKSAAVVLDDYDLGKAAQDIAERATMMTGQVCASLTRVIVPRRRHDSLLEALAASFGSIRVGDPFHADTQMGPVATAAQRNRVEGYITGARADGFTLATGGGRPKHLNRGFFVEPTVFGHVDNGSRLAREEVFGPVLAVIPAEDEEDAIRLADAGDFGLAGAVFTKDADRAYQVARQIRTGTVSHNAYKLDFSIAFGGFKQSGLGREGGVEGLLPYLETKTLLLDALPSHVPA